jgi:hypothetical protein
MVDLSEAATHFGEWLLCHCGGAINLCHACGRFYCVRQRAEACRGPRVYAPCTCSRDHQMRAVKG